MRSRRVIVIGAGIGGLVSALLLAARGLDVIVLERAATPGGKMRRVAVDGALVDSGPTVFTMRWILEQIFQAAGTSLANEVKLSPLDMLARHAWRKNERLDLFADVARSTDAIGQFAGASEAKRFVRFCAEARRVYQTLEGPYIRSAKPTLASLPLRLGTSGLGVLASLGPFATMWRRLSRHFHDYRLQQLFARYATYCGSSPFAAPATLMLVAQVEMDGVWSVDGGMHAVANAAASLAERRGASLRYNQHCAEILVTNGHASGVRLASGEEVHADFVVFNGDVNALASGMLGDAARSAVRAVPLRKRSLSAITWSINARTSGFPLERHNVFFANDYANEFRDIFKHHRLPENATVYVCAQDRGGTSEISRSTAERLLCLVNAPAIGDVRPLSRHLSQAEIDRCERTSFHLLHQCGLTIDRQPHNTVLTTPRDWNNLFPATGGALYGAASHGWMSAFSRPSSTSKLPGLYLAGGSAHPGPGVPMAAMSGQLAAATLMAHLDSTRQFHPVATSGGMSMP
jgi:1-hydroxycarotenoid 3,4-desaturase